MKMYLKNGWPLILLIFLAIVGYYLHASSSNSMNRKMKETAEELRLAITELGNSSQKVNAYLKVKTDIARYLPTIFSKDDPQVLIDRVRREAVAYGLYLVDIQVDIPKFMEARNKPEMMALMPFKVSFSGDYRSIGNFIENLEMAPYLHTISEMNIAIKDPGGSALSMVLKGAFRVFDLNALDWYTKNGT